MESLISTSVLGLALDYIKWDPNAETRREVQAILDKKDVVALKTLLGGRLQFGTAGLRGPMGGGYSRMNDLVILQTSQGLIKYLLEAVGEGAKGAGLVIGYDHRKFGSLSSLNFARMCAAVFLRQGFQVYLLEGFVATPLVAFAVRKLGCCCGVMVTASHNPKRDNGFKVYWGSGSQIIPPHDAGIAAAIDANLAPWQEEYDCDNVLTHPLAKDVTDEIADAYYSEIVKLLAAPRASPDGATAPRPRLAYTAMHGVGRKWVQRAFRAAGLSDEDPTLLSVVPSQAEPDAEFPTVTFPNPEEKGALDEAMRWASAQGCPVIIANDPDADRLAAAELVSPGQWRVFTGNEIGVLLGHWLIRQFKASAGEEVNPQSCFNLPALPAVLCSPCQQRPAVLASVVSSRMLSRIAAAENIQYFDTLTGFKWLGNKAASLQASGTKVLFSYEEALGYCCGEVVNDKDGVSAAIVFADMVNFLYSAGSTLSTQLATIYAAYGRCASHNSYVFCHDPALTDRIFERVREKFGMVPLKAALDGGSALEVCGSAVTRLTDVTLGLDSGASDGQADLPVTADSHMLMYSFANGVTVTLRTSGTEPKIKFYTELAGAPGATEGEEEMRARLQVFVSKVVDEMLQPKLHGLASP